MKILYFIIPLASVLLIACGAAFFWAVRSHQFDDLEGPAHRILFDDDADDQLEQQIKQEQDQ